MALPLSVLLQGLGFASIHAINLLLIAALLAGFWRREAHAPSSLALVVLAWASWLWLSLIWAGVGWVALRAAFAMSVLPLGFLITREFSTGQWRRLSSWMLLAAGIVILWGMAQLWQGGQPRAGFGQRNLAGAFTLPVALLATGWWLAGGRRGTAVLAVIPWLFIALVQSRGLWFAALPATLLLCLLAGGVPAWRRVAPLALVLALLVLSFQLPGGLGKRSVSDLQVARISLAGVEGQATREAAGAFGDSSLGQRLVIWRAALAMLEQAPWYGIGAQHFYQRYPLLITPEDQSAGQYAHNDYLQLLIELGWPGLLLTLGIYLLAAGRSWSRLRSGDPSPGRQVEIASLLAGITAIALHALVSYDHYAVPILLLLGMLLGRLDRLTLSAGEGLPVALSLPRRWLVSGAFLAMVLPALPAASEWYHRQGTQRLAVGDLAGAEAALSRAAVLFDTDEVEYARAITYIEALKALSAGDTERRSQLHQWALEALEKSARINPWNADVHFGRGLLAELAPDLEGPERARTAERAWRRCLRMDPRHFLCREHLARLLVRKGEGREARLLLEQGTAWSLPDDPAIAPYMMLLADLRERQGDTEPARRLRGRLARLREHWNRDSSGVSLSP